MKVFEDPYKSEGIVQLKIEKLSQFAQGDPLNSFRQSDAIYVRGLPWKIIAKILENDCDKQVESNKQRVLGYFLKCTGSTENAGLAWNCNCSATLKVLVRKNGKEDYAHKFNMLFTAEQRSWGNRHLTFEELMNPEKGWYDEATDSIILQVQIAANVPHGVKNIPDDIYTKYTMRSEHALFIELKDGFGFCTTNQYNTSNLVIEDKLWSFNYSPGSNELKLEMSMHQSDTSKTTAECLFWYWNDKEIAILQKVVYTFGEAMVNNADSGMKFARIAVPTNDAIPVNKKFNVVIRLLEERISNANQNNSMESYYGDYGGIDKVTLSIAGTEAKSSFVVSKHDLMRVSPVFERMFANEMTEKATGKVEIEDTNPEEFGEFLKAISPKQERPNPSNVFALLKLADRYDCQLLRNRCERHLMNCIEIPLINRFTCSNFYGLNKLKNNLMVSLDGTGLFKLLQKTEPYLGILKEITRKRKHT